jgi:hypothetical protein
VAAGQVFARLRKSEQQTCVTDCWHVFKPVRATILGKQAHNWQSDILAAATNHDALVVAVHKVVRRFLDLFIGHTDALNINARV